MSHLRVLEEGGLVTTRRQGRTKLHYLNPVPIRLVHNRWISKYTEPTVGAIADLKAQFEGVEPMTKPNHVYQAYIAAEPKEVWKAITDGDYTVQYFYGTRVESDWSEGSELRYLGEDGSVVADGSVIAIDPPHRPGNELPCPLGSRPRGGRTGQGGVAGGGCQWRFQAHGGALRRSGRQPDLRQLHQRVPLHRLRPQERPGNRTVVAGAVLSNNWAVPRSVEGSPTSHIPSPTSHVSSHSRGSWR